MESGEIGCSLFTEYVSVDKMNEPDLHVSTWVTLKSIMLCNRRQTAKRYFIGILLCKFYKHTKQNWILFVDIYICSKSKKKMHGNSKHKSEDCLVFREGEVKGKLGRNASISIYNAY